ncbi:hypothetical protein HDU91_007254 [Kappamyces sp. JEL0680]|nr:hypothetical protein HDU91_007254 [Kappamyces sp. JEL0680]
MSAPLGKQFHHSVNTLIYIVLTLTFLLDASLISLLARAFANAFQRSLLKVHSLRTSCLAMLVCNSAFILRHLVASPDKSLTTNSPGRADYSLFLLLSLDCLVGFLQMLRGIVLPLNQMQIGVSFPYMKYSFPTAQVRSIASPDLLVSLEQIDELVTIPVFSIDFARFIAGIICGMKDVGIRLPTREASSSVREMRAVLSRQFNQTLQNAPASRDRIQLPV